MKKVFKRFCIRRGFSLAEVLAALIISSMVLVAVVGIYRRCETCAASIIRNAENKRLPSEALQRIAEDLDRIITSSPDSKITIENKLDNLFQTAKMTILKTHRGEERKKERFDEIIWQSNYGYESDATGLILYRSYNGIGFEDKLFDESRETWEEDYSFVPICSGVTLFKIEAMQEQQLVDSWSGDELPRGVVVTISFAEPYKTIGGYYEVEEFEKVSRIITIDRTRKIAFKFVKKEYRLKTEDEEGFGDEDEEGLGEEETKEVDEEQEREVKKSEDKGDDKRESEKQK